MTAQHITSNKTAIYTFLFCISPFLNAHQQPINHLPSLCEYVFHVNSAVTEKQRVTKYSKVTVIASADLGNKWIKEHFT
jgi:hypothetical protein